MRQASTLPAGPASVTSTRLAPIAALIGSIVSLTIGTSFAERLFPVAGAEGMTALRIGFAALLLCALWRPWRRRLTRAEAGTVVAYGLVLGTMNLLFYKSIAKIPLGIAIAIEFVGPLAVAILSSRRASDFVWAGLAATGLLLLLPLGRSTTPLDPMGVIYAGCAAVCWGAYIVVGKRAGSLPGGQAVSLGMATAALVALPFGIARAGVVLLRPDVLALGVAVAVMSSAIPYSLEMIALRRLPKQTFGILLSLEPAAGALAALAILGERLSGQQWLAIAAIIAASAGSATGRRSADVPPGG